MNFREIWKVWNLIFKKCSIVQKNPTKDEDFVCNHEYIWTKNTCHIIWKMRNILQKQSYGWHFVWNFRWNENDVRNKFLKIFISKKVGKKKGVLVLVSHKNFIIEYFNEKMSNEKRENPWSGHTLFFYVFYFLLDTPWS